MQKVPVGASIAHAYQFLFGRFFQIVGTAWLPALLYGLGAYAYLLNMPQMPMHGASAAAVASGVGFALVGALIGLVIRAVLGISLTQEAFGVRKDLTLAHFVIGPRELRLFFAQLRFVALFLALYIAVIAVSLGAIVAARTFGAGLAPKLAMGGMPIAVLAAAILAFVLVVWFVLSMLRLEFILAAVASVEHKVRLLRAWRITRGSSWRVFTVYVVTFLPVIAAAWIAGYFLLGPGDVAKLMAAIGKIKPGEPSPIIAFYNTHALTMASIAAVLSVVGGALLAGASATAYRAVTGHEDPEPEDDAALIAPLVTPVEQHEPSVEPLPPVPDLGDHAEEIHGGHEQGDHAVAAHDDHAPAEHREGHEDHGNHSEPHGEDHAHDGGLDAGVHHTAPVELTEEVHDDASEADAGHAEALHEDHAPGEQHGTDHAPVDGHHAPPGQPESVPA